MAFPLPFTGEGGAEPTGEGEHLGGILMAARRTEAHWRDFARTPRFFIMDSLAALPLFIFILHIRWWTFITAIVMIIFLMILERFKFTIPVFKRWLRSTLAGPLRTSKPWWRT